MTTDINTILSYETINLSPFEIRGARSGVNNASTTGPVYTGGTFVPADSSVGGNGSFSSDTTVSSFSFNAPYGSLDTDSLKIGDNLTANAVTFRITGIDTTSSFQIDSTAAFSGPYPLSLDLDQREYVTEPDITRNTKTGQADFSSGSLDVTGSGFNVLTGGDFIKHDGYQEYFRIAQVYDDTSLDLVSAYSGDTTSGTYTGKKWKIGLTKIQYAKNNFTYDGQKAKWVYDSIIENDLTTSTSFAPLADGIELAFTRALNADDPDLMDVAVTNNHTFATETQYEAFQFALPAVPNPELSMELFINDAKKDMYQDYVLTYSQSPLYETPPPPDQRYVANVMFLNGISGIQPSTGLTESGQMLIVDSEGEAVPGIFAGSESIGIDGTAQLALRDYMLEPNTGTLEVTDTIVEEQIVKYVADDFSEYVDYGFSVFLNGKKQKISFPAETDDNIIFQPYNGRVKPRDKGHPGPGDVYGVNYMVETTSVSDEIKEGVPGSAIIALNKYPVKQDSIFLAKNKTFLEEGVDFFVSYLTGRILLEEASTGNDIFQISYTPLSKQVNDLTYENGAWYCTAHDTRLTVQDAVNFKFTLANVLLDVNNIEILQIYNETRDKDYSLTGYDTDGTFIILQKDSMNVSVGLAAEDVVVIDYKYVSETLEYSPVVVNYLNVEEGSEAVYIEGSDLTSFINTNALMVLARPDAASETYHAITSASYDTYGTKINLNTPVPEDVVNPRIGISDSSSSFLPVPLKAAPLVKGSTEISFPGTNIRDIFRPKTILDTEEDLYQVSSATYDSETSSTTVSLSSEILTDRTDTASLSNIKYSDNPVYSGGGTEIVPAMSAVTLFNQPAFIMNNDSDRVLNVTSTSTELIIDSTTFSYETSSTLGDLSSAIDTSNIDALALTIYAPAWQSDKIIPVTDVSVYRDSSTVLYASDALRYKDIDATVYTDSSNFTVSEAGTVILTNGLQRGDRYKFDYLGRKFLGDDQVEYSLRYFVSLSAKSKIAASFQYNNLDQFYIQVMNQMDFLERVTIPRMEEEAKQLNGSIGQGGSLPTDDGPTNDDGGITGDEYRRKDTEIECRVFKNIYDFYQNRLLSYGTEMEAGLGLRLFNNDGTFSEVEQDAAAKVISRIFPDTDYTNFEPIKVNPLTGYFFDSDARFTKNDATVTGTNTYWTEQLLTGAIPNGGYIGSADSTRRYGITSVSNNTTLTLNGTFEENTVTGEYTATNNRYPIYDDDGFLGGKIIGSKNKDFGLISGDAFNCTIDNTPKDYTFEFPTGPFIGDLFSNPDGPTVARLLTSGVDGLTCAFERVLDPATTYGYKNTLVMRTTFSANKLEMGDNTTVDKLGFSSDQTAIGNLDRTDQRPEIILDEFERNFISAEQGYLDTVIAPPGISGKLDRTNPIAITAVNNAAIEMTDELNTLLEEIPKIEAQISATENIIAEGGIPSGDASAAHLAAMVALTDASAAKADVDPILLNWDGKAVNWKWSLDFTEHAQYVRGLNSFGIGVASGWVTPIEGQTSFILQAPAGNDRRILDAMIFSVLYTPSIVGEMDSSNTIPGVWTGWEVSYDYSLNNQITFTINTPTVITLTDAGADPTLRYVTDETAVNLLWEDLGDTTQEVYRYVDYNSVGAIKAELNSSAKVSASGSAFYNSNPSEAFELKTEYINPTADIKPGLRRAYVTYQTISERLLDDRTSFILNRDDPILSDRIDFLETREPQLYNSIASEGLLLDGSDPGDIYAWANNRFNRRQGSYAKLKQIEAQIAANESALEINKNFI